MHIATLDEGRKAEMEMTIDKGRGYVPPSATNSSTTRPRVIPMDSIYTPVTKGKL